MYDSYTRYCCLIFIIIVLVYLEILLNTYGIFGPLPAISGVRKSAGNVTKKDCTFGLLRQYNNTRHNMPGEGHWKKSTYSQIYQLDICGLDLTNYTRDHLVNCLIQDGVRSIVIYGDSYGSHISEGLLSKIHNGKNTCISAEHEKSILNGFDPDGKLYTGVDSNFVKRHICHVTGEDGSHDISMEDISGETNVNENTVTVTDKSLNKTMQISLEEFYFKYFLKDKYPDIFVISTIFNHTVNKKHKIYLEPIRKLKAMIDKYIPTTTKIFFIPNFKQFVQLNTKVKSTGNVPKHFHSSMSEKLTKSLHKIFGKDLINPPTNIYGFLDLLKISKDMEDMSTDGTHVTTTYYELIISMFWETYCNSVILHDF